MLFVSNKAQNVLTKRKIRAIIETRRQEKFVVFWIVVIFLIAWIKG